MRHIPEDELHAYLDQALSRSQCVEIESHLAGCLACSSARDEIAGLRDRTTALLGRLAPPPGRIGPPWPELEERATAEQARSRRRTAAFAWAASIALAGAVGWMARDMARVPTTAIGGEPPAATAAIGQPVPANGGASVVEPAATPPGPVPVAGQPGRAASIQPTILAVAPDDTAAGKPMPPPPSGMALKASNGGEAALPLDRVWRTISWDRVRDDSNAWVPRVEGFPVTKVQVSQGTTGGMSVVSQQLASGQTIRTVAGPAADVSSLLRRQGGQVATASLQEDQRASGRATGDRMLVIMGDVPADSLQAFLLRVR